MTIVLHVPAVLKMYDVLQGRNFRVRTGTNDE